MDQLIEIWQSAHTDQRNMDKKYKPEDLIPQVIKLEKNQKKVIQSKTYITISILFVLLIIYFSKFPVEINSALGIGILVTSILGSVISLNKLRFKISDEERSLSMHTLVGVIESKIKTERKLFTVYLPVILIIVILGINMMYIDFLSELETRTRIFYHGILTVSMLIAFLLGLSVRIRRFKKRFLPLLNRIQKLKSALDNQV